MIPPNSDPNDWPTLPDHVPSFGKEMLDFFSYKKGFVNLNHGSFGGVPNYVRDYTRRMEDEIALEPDRFYRKTQYDLMPKIRERLAKFVNADKDEIVLVHSASLGSNAVLRNSIDWKQGDKILHFSNLYPTSRAFLNWTRDHGPEVGGVEVAIEYPITDDEIIKRVEQAVIDHNESPSAKEGKSRIRIAVIEAILSTPGTQLPWPALVKLLHKHNILVFVDGAHCIGQVPLDLHAADPDYFVTNTHKWFYTPFSATLLYVAKRHQDTFSSSPISMEYVIKGQREQDINYFQAAYAWPIMLNIAPYFAVIAAMDFREHIGGEEKIRQYTHDLAVKGGELVAKILGTRTMDIKGSNCTASMANVELPYRLENLSNGNSSSKQAAGKISLSQVAGRFPTALMDKYNTFATIYPHAGSLWARLSANVYNDISDFEHMAEAIKAVCREEQQK